MDEFYPPLPFLDDYPFQRHELHNEVPKIAREEKGSLARRLYITLRNVLGETSWLLGPGVLEAIRKRTAQAPGRWYTATHTPVVSPGYGERLINAIPHKTKLAMRRGKKIDEWAEWNNVATVFDTILKPAYQAHRDVTTLIRAVERLTALDSAVRELIRIQEAHRPDWREQLNTQERIAWVFILDALAHPEPDAVDTTTEAR